MCKEMFRVQNLLAPFQMQLYNISINICKHIHAHILGDNGFSKTGDSIVLGCRFERDGGKFEERTAYEKTWSRIAMRKRLRAENTFGAVLNTFKRINGGLKHVSRSLPTAVALWNAGRTGYLSISTKNTTQSSRRTTDMTRKSFVRASTPLAVAKDLNLRSEEKYRTENQIFYQQIGQLMSSSYNPLVSKYLNSKALSPTGYHSASH